MTWPKTAQEVRSSLPTYHRAAEPGEPAEGVALQRFFKHNDEVGNTNELDGGNRGMSELQRVMNGEQFCFLYSPRLFARVQVARQSSTIYTLVVDLASQGCPPRTNTS